jgi:hypothetical protein
MMFTEGLRRGDLNGMILPLLSIDEFSSKIDDRTVIVVAFYTFEEDPAHDLSNFIERSPQSVLDTDVSPAPTREGYYVTFVEIRRDSKFIPKLLKILNEVDNLTDVKQWQFTSQNLPPGKVLPVSEENLKKWVHVKSEPPTNTNKPDAQQLMEWFSHSALHDVQLFDTQLHLHRAGITHVYEVVSLQMQPPDGALQLMEHDISMCNRLERMLDGAYEVHVIQDHVVVHNLVNDSYLVLNQKI